MSKENPQSFSDLDVKTLRRTAVEDFAVPVAADANKQTVLAALAEQNIGWDMYCKLMGWNLPAATPAAAPEVGDDADADEPVVQKTYNVGGEEVIIRTAEAPTPNVQEKFLVKMERKNPQYNTRGHKFTQDHPYALVDREVCDYLLEKEDGFRMATPRELEEFYG